MKYSQPYGVVDPRARYVNGNPATGTQGSIPPATALDEDQFEIEYVISQAGFTPSHADLTQLWQALQSMFAQRYITTSIVKTVHGAGADFPDLHAAFDWLSRYIITPNGFVTFMVAAGKWTYTQTVEINHPNANRVAIQGAALKGATPSPPNMSVTGYFSATDGTNQIIYLRSVHSTELSFAGGGPTGIRVFRDGITFRYLLITGDQTVGPPSQPPSFSGLSGGIGLDFYASGWLDGCSVWGFGAIGIQITGCTVTSLTSLSVTVSYCGAGASGLGINVSYGFFNTPGTCQIICTSCKVAGLNLFGSTCFLGTLTVRGCDPPSGNMCVQVEAGSQLNARGATIRTNNRGGVIVTGGWLLMTTSLIADNNGPGLQIYGGGSAFVDQSTFSGNASYAILANGGCFVEALGASLGGGTSPPVNTYDVAWNAFIAY